MSITQVLANYIYNIKYDQIPEQALDIAKKAINDFLGVAIAGRDMDGPVILKDYILEQSGIPESSVPGYKFKTSALYSALLCGTMGHVLDYDDAASSMSGHAGAILVPVIWALGDKYNITGKRALEAFIAGFEGASLVGLYLRPAKPNAGTWHKTKQLGVLGSTLAAAKIIDLSEDQIRAALGIASSLAGGLMRNFGTMMKSFHAGSAAHDGILAAMMAKKGFTANMDILEIEKGFRDVFLPEGGPTEDSIIALIKKGQWDILTNGIMFKKYPSCGGTHKAIDTILDLVKKENIKPDEVESIVIKTQAWIYNVAHITKPKTGLEGKFSIEFTVAAAVTDRCVRMSHFVDENIQKFEPLMKKVIREAETEASDSRRATLLATVTLKDGRFFEHSLDTPRSIMPWDDLWEKYRECMSPYFSQDIIDKSKDMIHSLEKYEQFQDLVSVFCD